MISKVAIQAGLGVTAVGGIVGVTTYFALKPKTVFLQEFIVVTDVATTVQPTKEMTDNNQKQYFCQWGAGENKKTDNSCLIQKITLDSNKKSVLFSKLNDSGILATSTKSDLNAKDHLFKLTITSNDGEISLSKEQIDILSKTEKDGDNFKKYGSVKTITRLSMTKENEKAQTDLVKTGTIIGKMISEPPSDNFTNAANYKCKWTAADSVANIEHNDPDLKPCDVYKFGTQPSPTNSKIDSFALTSSDKTTQKSDFTKNHYYIINFTDDKNFKSTSELLKKDNNLAVFYVEVATSGTTVKKVGNFSIEAALVGNISGTFSSSEFIIFN